ncbi:tail fiber assembly protein [Xenorhabdus bovienii]|uniref:tail fiber assembly protein n=1 Tax=Xenorhabdus bovienii TaxID=40576 RepID=UPI0023B2A058|nr:tail fiber assembly protein [Xenorhabdus bovienii]MDE9494792.1 tail fiber assembly protein [Xenorhabdus bovienii]MDE9503141.1 tail fiber assembly protein [Xenorhabdus bovienii]MDE9526936.1 tail fiber assembly protein [Xenorhabdus bovienii]
MKNNEKLKDIISAVVQNNKVPRRVNYVGAGIYQSETITEAQKTALVSQVESEKSQKLTEANTTITYLQDAVDVGLANDEYETRLKDWKTYRVLLNRVDTSTAPDVDWPQKP